MPTPNLAVAFSAAAEAQLDSLVPSFRLLSGREQARRAITEVLTGDPRSVHWRQNRAGVMYGFSIDALNVECHFEGQSVTVTQVQHIDLCDRSHVPKVEQLSAPPASC